MSLPPPGQSIFFISALLPEGWAANVRVEIADGHIAKLEQGVSKQPADELVYLGLPGLANVHSHGFQRGMAGLTEYRGPDADNFWSWRELMYRFVARMEPADLEAITALAYIEMLESGFTRVGEFHYVHHDAAGESYANRAEMAERVAAAAVQAGIGLTLMPVFYAHGGFGGAAPAEGQRRFVNELDDFAKLFEESRRVIAPLEGALLGVAPHSLRAVTPEELRSVVKLGGNGPVHIHAAEQMKEVADCVAWSGARPVEWLLDQCAVDRRWCLVHATHMTDIETRRLAASGAVAGLCPITEANLGDGVSNAAGFTAAGGAIGIGTDSNVLIGAAAELRQLEYSQRLRDRARNVVAHVESRSTGRALFDRALAGGARATGIGELEAGIVAGARADFISLALTAPEFASRKQDAVLDSWIFASPHGCIDSVWSAGRKVVAGGRHVAREAVLPRFRAAVARLLASR
jgi:formimidoylglutamate deiminase